MSGLKINLMGSPSIQFEGRPVILERRKAVALLAYLALTQNPVSRDYLATMLWGEHDQNRARASLRRTLSVINKTPVAQWLNSDRHVLHLRQDSTLLVDVLRLDELCNDHLNLETMTEAVGLYQTGFMTGFSLRDSAGFDEWQSFQAQTIQNTYLARLEELSEQMLKNAQYADAIPFLLHILQLDPLDESAMYHLLTAYLRIGKQAQAKKTFETYQTTIQEELGIQPSKHLISLFAYHNEEPVQVPSLPGNAIFSNLPPRPGLVVGRARELEAIKRRIGVEDTHATMRNVVIQGWPGIGKTTLTALLAHDYEVHGHFSDGILWVSLGETPNTLARLIGWGKALNSSIIHTLDNIQDVTQHLAALLRDKSMLLIIDDVWNVQDALPMQVGGEQCTTVMTTRMNDVAQALVATPDDIYRIPILSEDNALTLLRKLAPEAVRLHPVLVKRLVSSLEGLPLALQVAGRLLHSEYSMGWDIEDLLNELTDGHRLLASDAPADRIDDDKTLPTVSSLLQRSTNRLDDLTRERFALLGVFAPKPASFELEAIQAVWQTDNPRSTLRQLVDRGLLEPLGNRRFQMHAVLVMHAKQMFAS